MEFKFKGKKLDIFSLIYRVLKNYFLLIKIIKIKHNYVIYLIPNQNNIISSPSRKLFYLEMSKRFFMSSLSNNFLIQSLQLPEVDSSFLLRGSFVNLNSHKRRAKRRKRSR